MAQTKTEIERELLSSLETEIETIKKHMETDPNYTKGPTDLQRLEKNFQNYEESASIIVIHEIQRLLKLKLDGKNIEMQLGFGPIRMEKDDEFFKAITSSGTDAEIIQRAYETLGYSDKLPTSQEIKSLENQAKSIQDPVEKLKIEKEIQLKKCKLGDLDFWQLGKPAFLSGDIEALYDERIAEAERERMMTDDAKQTLKNQDLIQRTM